MQPIRLLVPLVLLAAIPAFAQVSFSFNAGVLKADEGIDPYGLGSTWNTQSGNINSDNSGMSFYAEGTATVIKASAMWEVSEIFSAGLAYKMASWKMETNRRTSDINSLGVQFRVNFVRNSNKVVPFFQGAFYFMNNSTLNQEQATQGAQTQPAFSLSQSTNIGFDADFGIEFIINKSWGLQLTGGFGGTQATDPNLVVNLDYGAYIPPAHIDGVFNWAFTGGLKYYMGRSVKQRDF